MKCAAAAAAALDEMQKRDPNRGEFIRLLILFPPPSVSEESPPVQYSVLVSISRIFIRLDCIFLVFFVGKDPS